MNPDAWLALIATLLIAGLNWWSRLNHDDRLETWTKPVVPVLLVVLALALDAPPTPTRWCIVALALCLVGDVALLARVDQFVVGLAAFLLGHLAFVGMFAALGFDRWRLAIPGLVAAVVVAATVGRRIVAAAAEHSLGAPVVAYLVVISAMAVLGWATGLVAVIAGSALFVVSDSVLGWRRFVRERAWMGVTIMVTYHLALMGLTLGLAG
jgi:uncharacterized membrane protein YhhN